MAEKQKSIIRSNLYYSLFSFLLILFLTGVILTLIKRHSAHHYNDLLIETASTYTVVLEEQIQIYKHLLSNISSEEEVIGLLLSSDAVMAEQWALHHNKYLPNSLGLALLTNDGELFGNPHALKVGLNCILDLQKHTEEHSFDSLPIHNRTPKLAHFDIISPILDPDGEPLGIAFASFYLTTLQDLIDNLVQEGQQLRVIKKDGSLVVETTLPANFDAAHQHKLDIEGSDWQLELLSTPIDTSQFENLVILVSLLIGTIIGMIVFMLSKRTCSNFLEEFQNIRSVLHNISLGSFQDNFKQPKFIEMSEVLPAIKEVTSIIHRQKQELLELSETDELTKLPNRRKFHEELIRMWQLSRRGLNCALMLIDLDNFKRINDSEGHAAGDTVLQLFANSLNKCRRETDIVGRQGGDEFAVLLPNAREEEAFAWYRRLTDSFIPSQKHHEKLSGKTICTISCGVVCMSPSTHPDFDEILINADEALYQAKSAGRDQVSLYEPNLSATVDSD